MVECRRAIDLLVDYIDGSIAPTEREHLLKHFADCPPCLEFLESYKRTSQLCKQTLLREAPKEVGERLTTFLRGHCRRGGGKDHGSR